MKMQNSETHFTSVPAFLSKLWALVDDPSTNDLIYWDRTGRSFHVSDQMRFSREILPMYFKHNNISSFIRQLNMYGFRKVMASDSLSLKSEKEDLEFAHHYFVRGQEHLLEAIKRKTSTQGQSLPQMSRSEVGKIMGEVSSLKQHIDSVTDSLESLKLENDILWKEMIDLRQKHARQQELVSKLLQFFASIISTERNPIKRKLPLMIRNSEASPIEVANLANSTGKNTESESMFSATELLDCSLPTPLATALSSNMSPSTPSPQHAKHMQPLDTPKNLVVKQEPKLVLRDFSREEMTKNLDSFQDSLDSLYDLLSNNNNNIYNLDAPMIEINGLADLIGDSNEEDGEVAAKKLKLTEQKNTDKNKPARGMELTHYIPPEEWLNLPQASDSTLDISSTHSPTTTTTDPLNLSHTLNDKDVFLDKDAFSEYIFDDDL